jgi:hypothetical protein
MPCPTLPPSVLPDISPTRGEIGSSEAGASSATLAIGETGPANPISPLVGEMSGRTEGGNVECCRWNSGLVTRRIAKRLLRKRDRAKAEVTPAP